LHTSRGVNPRLCFIMGMGAEKFGTEDDQDNDLILICIVQGIKKYITNQLINITSISYQ
jgi:hypothetical protein